MGWDASETINNIEIYNDYFDNPDAKGTSDSSKSSDKVLESCMIM